MCEMPPKCSNKKENVPPTNSKRPIFVDLSNDDTDGENDKPSPRCDSLSIVSLPEATKSKKKKLVVDSDVVAGRSRRKPAMAEITLVNDGKVQSCILSDFTFAFLSHT